MNNIVRQFSLCDKGGIRFPGYLLSPTKGAVLVVGLGGTGIDALLRVKEEVLTRMQLPKDHTGKIVRTSPGNIGFLAIDSDDSARKKTYGSSCFDSNGSEFISIAPAPSYYTFMQAGMENRKVDPVWSWCEMNCAGCKGVPVSRQCGRSLLFRNIKRITESLERSVLDIFYDFRLDRYSELRIIVLTGIGGSTGSGIFLDIAYLLRSIAERYTERASIYGYIFTPDLNPGYHPELLNTNGFAALKELEHWMSAGDHGEHFCQEYPDGIRVDSDRKPFDYCHLITGRKQNGMSVSYEEALDITVKGLFRLLVGDDAEDCQSADLAMMYDGIFAGVDMQKTKAHYLSIGAAELEIPYKEIATLIAARLFEKMDPMLRRQPEQSDIDEALYRTGLNWEQLISYMKLNIPPCPAFYINVSLQESELFKDAESWLFRIAQPKVRGNGLNLAPIYERRILEYIGTVMKDSDRGPTYAARLIRNLITELEDCIQKCRERIQSGDRMEREENQRLKECYAECRSASFFRRRQKEREYKELFLRWLDFCLDYQILCEMEEGLHHLLERLIRNNEKIFTVLEETLMHIPYAFARNASDLYSDEYDPYPQYPEKVRKQLIRPLRFESAYAERLENGLEAAVKVFGESVLTDLQKWTGFSLGEADRDLPEGTDVKGALSDFICRNFWELLTTDTHELFETAADGVNVDVYLREKLDAMHQNAEPLCELREEERLTVPPRECAVTYVSGNCPDIWQMAGNTLRADEILKLSREFGKTELVKIKVGVPVFALTVVREMENSYEELTVSGDYNKRKGIHLRPEWGKYPPSPIPGAARFAGKEDYFGKPFFR